jgi:hypothetical protein
VTEAEIPEEKVRLKPMLCSRIRTVSGTPGSKPVIICTDPDPDPSFNKQKAKKTAISTIL